MLGSRRLFAKLTRMPGGYELPKLSLGQEITKLLPKLLYVSTIANLVKIN